MLLVKSWGELMKTVLEEEAIKIMGAGRLARKLLETHGDLLAESLEEVLVSDKSGNPEEIYGFAVRELAPASEEECDQLILLAAVPRYWKAMAENLRAHGYHRFAALDDNLIQQLLDRVRPLAFDAAHVHRLLRYEVQLAEHCNLNCRGCTHFAPLAEKEFLDVEEYRRDCERLGELFHGEVDQIHLMGGEPLLHPDVIKIAEMTRRCFPYGRIMIVTNGVLLPKMPDAFWQACHDHDIEITPTKYPISIDYAAMEQKAKAFHVKYWYYGGGQMVKTLFRWPFRERGDCPIEQNWYHCDWANHCITLRHGKLYPCAEPAHIHHLERYFGVRFPLAVEDSIDIYEAASGEEILETCAKPIPFCRYCNLGHVEDGFAFGRSKKELGEWIDE